MEMTFSNNVLAEAFGANEGKAQRIKQIALVLFGVVALAISAKISIPMWPVPVTMGTFTVLALAVGYGPRIGLITIISYMIVGSLGLDVFAGSSAELNGVTYMMGSTGGYLLGFVFATLALGVLARNGWDRSPVKLAGALLIGNILIYIPGLFWLGTIYGWDKPILEWGMFPFLIGDGLKLCLAVIIIPNVWKIAGKARG